MAALAQSGRGLAAAPPRRRSAAVRMMVRLVREKPLGAVGAAVCLVFLFCGIFADVLAPHGVNQIMPINRFKAPSLAFPFGTDGLGRDVFSRVLFGAQLS